MNNRSCPISNAVLPEDLFVELLPVFLEEISAMMEQINAAMEKDDLRNVKIHAHKIYGSALSFGASYVAEASHAIELVHKVADIYRDQLMEKLNKEWVCVKDYCIKDLGVAFHGG